MSGGRLAATGSNDTETTMFRHALLATATAAAVAAPSVAHADRYEDQVRAQMIGKFTVATAAGFTMTDPIQFGALRQGQTMTYTLTLERNREYVLAGSCDTDCSDLDVALGESDGSEVVADRGADDQPSIVVRGHGGTHTVRVTMARCSVGPCRYGLGVFAR
jgi:hypothetical protein